MTIEEKHRWRGIAVTCLHIFFPFEVAIDRMMILFSIVSLGYRFTYFIYIRLSVYSKPTEVRDI